MQRRIKSAGHGQGSLGSPGVCDDRDGRAVCTGESNAWLPDTSEELRKNHRLKAITTTATRANGPVNGDRLSKRGDRGTYFQVEGSLSGEEARTNL